MLGVVRQYVNNNANGEKYGLKATTYTISASRILDAIVTRFRHAGGTGEESTNQSEKDDSTAP